MAARREDRVPIPEALPPAEKFNYGTFRKILKENVLTFSVPCGKSISLNHGLKSDRFFRGSEGLEIQGGADRLFY
jgi:hypothetical protein